MGIIKLIFGEEVEKELKAPPVSRVVDAKQEPFTPARPRAAQASTPSSYTSLIFKLLILLIPLLIYGGYHWYQSTQASTTINQTLSTNDDLENGLVGHWTFDGPTIINNIREVASTSPVHLYIPNGRATTTIVTAGKIGQGLVGDGSSSGYLSSTNTPISISSDNYTVCLWVKPDDISSLGSGGQEQTVFSMVSSFSNYISLSIPVGSFTGQIRSTANINAGTFTKRSSSAVLATSTWTHICTTKDTVVNIYADGNAVGTANSSTITPTTRSKKTIMMGLGGSDDSNEGAYRGKLDDVRVYNRVLSASEVKRLYELGGTTHINTTIDTNDDLENGLTGHWTFDGPDMNWSSSTAEVLDHSIYSREGNVTNFNQTQVSGGRIGQALRFDGVNDYVRTATDVTSFISTTAYTLSVWVRPTDNSGSSTASYLPGIIQDYEQYIWINNGYFKSQDKIWSGFFDGSLHQVGVPYNLNEWVHITTVYSNNTISMYKNGQLATSTASPDFSHMGGDLTLEIGRNGWQSQYFKGDIDDARIYNRALSASEVKRLYELGATTHINTTIDTNDDLENGLVGHWTFDGPMMAWGSTTAEVLDSSSSSIEGDMVNMDQQSVTPGKMGQGLNFVNGVGSYVLTPSTTPLTNLNTKTVSAWIKPRSSGESSGGRIITKNQWFMSVSGSQYAFVQTFSTLPGIWSTTANLFDINEWTHIAVTYNRSSTVNDPIMYINGVSVPVTETLTPSGSVSGDAGSQLSIGGGSSDLDFDGAIDDVRIYNRVLSAAEIKRLYELGGGR